MKCWNYLVHYYVHLKCTHCLLLIGVLSVINSIMCGTSKVIISCIHLNVKIVRWYLISLFLIEFQYYLFLHHHHSYYLFLYFNSIFNYFDKVWWTIKEFIKWCNSSLTNLWVCNIKNYECFLYHDYIINIFFSLIYCAKIELFYLNAINYFNRFLFFEAIIFL